MKKTISGLLGVLAAALLLVFPFSCNLGQGTGEAAFSVVTADLLKTAMPTGLDLEPDYFLFEGNGPGGASVSVY